MSEALLTRIADALDRLAPPPVVEADAGRGLHFRWDQRRLLPVRAATPLPPGRFVGVDHQIAALRQNLSALASGAPAHDMLLWGARGTGKSALVRSIAFHAGVALVETSGDALPGLPALFDRLARLPRPFLVYVDDLAFTGTDPGVRMLRSLLDGGVAERPANVRMAVTSNHRHLVMRDADVTDASGGPRHARDVADDQLALADRFGLILGFHVPSQEEYLEMVRRHLEGARFDPQDALAFALARGGRSGRTAWHYRTEFLSRKSTDC